VRNAWALCLVALSLSVASVATAAAPPQAPETKTTPKKKRLPRIIARALGIVTSTVAQTKAQAPPRPAKNYFNLIPEPLLIAELEARHAQPGPLSARVERVSRGLLGAPYLLGALGEGQGTSDPDPRFRLDAFDCTTLVETVIALTRHDHPEGAARLLDKIRYIDNKTAFNDRRHLMTSQWIPGLVKEGWLKDITAEVGGDQTRTIKFNLSKKRWQRRHIAKALVLPEHKVPQGVFPLKYLPTAQALLRAKQIPAGTIINVVRADWAASPDLITHQGVIIVPPGGTQRYVRHASPLAKRVVDEELEHMLQRYIDKPGNWSVQGVNLLSIQPDKEPPLSR